MQPALPPMACYSVSRSQLRSQKEKLRDRLYTPVERVRRDALLSEFARRALALGAHERDE